MNNPTFSQKQIRLFLSKSISLARDALAENNYPIGCVAVDETGKIIAQSSNQCSTLADVTAHAEILILKKLGKRVDKKTKAKLFLFTSLEPCFGCSFFIARTNICAVYSALKDPHKGGISDLQDKFRSFFNSIKTVNEPFDDLADQSRKLMSDYFINTGQEEKAKYYQKKNI
jgi:tRNA(adenine34) deaminase